MNIINNCTGDYARGPHHHTILSKSITGFVSARVFAHLRVIFLTLVRRGGITNHRLMVYSLSSISAKNYKNQLCIKVMLCNITVIF